MASVDLRHALDVALAAVRAAGAAELVHHRAGVRVETKIDRSPVTEADREGERVIRQVIADVFPDHGFLGEETGGSVDAEYVWVVDPIDGTRGFCRGGAFWGPLVALTRRGEEALVGAMALPLLGATYGAARGLGCWKDGERLQVSRIAALEDATLSLGEMQHLFRRPEAPALTTLVTRFASSRGYGDLAGCAMLLEGRAEAWIEAGVQLWDLAPLQVLVEEAGGTFTDLHGARSIRSGHALATNGLVHDVVLDALGTRR